MKTERCINVVHKPGETRRCGAIKPKGKVCGVCMSIPYGTPRN